MFIEDGGLRTLRWAPQRRGVRVHRRPSRPDLIETLKALVRLNAFDHIMPVRPVERRQTAACTEGRIAPVDWNIAKSAKTIEAVVKTHEKLAHNTGGTPLVL